MLGVVWSRWVQGWVAPFFFSIKPEGLYVGKERGRGREGGWGRPDDTTHHKTPPRRRRSHSNSPNPLAPPTPRPGHNAHAGARAELTADPIRRMLPCPARRADTHTRAPEAGRTTGHTHMQTYSLSRAPPSASRPHIGPPPAPRHIPYHPRRDCSRMTRKRKSNSTEGTHSGTHRGVL